MDIPAASNQGKDHGTVTRVLLSGVSVSVSAFIILITLDREVGALSSPFFRAGEGFVIYAFSIPTTAFGVVVPTLASAWLFRNATLRMQREPGLALHRALMSEINRSDVPPGLILIVWAFLFPIYLFIEDFMPLSVEPLTTPVCAVFCLLGGYWLFKRFRVANRVAILALLLSLVLATEYVDWNPRKSMLRDLYGVRSGMTADEVKRAMSGHITGEYGDLENDGHLLFISGRGAAYNADIATVTLINGRVSAVDFSHD